MLALPIVKSRSAEVDITRVFEAENSSKPDDDSYSGNARNAAGGEDDDALDAEETDEGGELLPAAQTAESEPGPQVDYFA
jgi:hypothetical protein